MKKKYFVFDNIFFEIYFQPDFIFNLKYKTHPTSINIFNKQKIKKKQENINQTNINIIKQFFK